MSAICGLLHPPHDPVPPDAPATMVSALAQDYAATADTTAYSGTLLVLWNVLLLGRWLKTHSDP